MSNPVPLAPQAQLEALIESWRARAAAIRRNTKDTLIEDMSFNRALTFDECADQLLAALPGDRGAQRYQTCDCGGSLTVCADCAVSDYQAAHPDCAACCTPVQQAGDRGAWHPIDWPAIEVIRTSLAAGEYRNREDFGETSYQFSAEAAIELLLRSLPAPPVGTDPQEPR